MKTKLQSLCIGLAIIAGLHQADAQVTNLGIAPVSGGQSLLFWPASMTNYVLQSSTNLNSASWMAVSDAVTMTAVVVSNTSPERFFRLYQDTNVPSGMALIPAGTFTMGVNLDDFGPPPTNVYVSAFYMDTNLVSYSQWQAVYNWATNHGYGFVNMFGIDNGGAGKAANHPVQTVDWFRCVKWCNARSQQAGLTPAYYTDGGYTQVFTNGNYFMTIYQNLTASGYRLPTEAEWEKAARGGLSGKRFPWGDTITEDQANYFAEPPFFIYDLNSYSGNNTNYYTGVDPYTSPVGSFAPNGYGLYDMAGNVYEWCWDNAGGVTVCCAAAVGTTAPTGRGAPIVSATIHPAPTTMSGFGV